MIRFRRMTEADIPAGLALCRAAGWNQTEADWRIFLKLAPRTTSVATIDDAVVGTVSILDYGSGFAWLSMLLVDPIARGKGVGTALFEHALELGSHIPCIRLDATPEGRRIYVKYGFTDDFGLTRWEGTPAAPPLSPNAEMEQDRMAQIDRQVFGADRSAALFSDPKAPHALGESGFALARRGFFADHIGPVVAADAHAAAALLQQLLLQLGGRPVILDVPDSAAAIVPPEFVSRRKLLRMSKGVNPSPGQPEKEFAIRGPEFG
jgi:GNAT superfamily N-acetyltransferase